MTGYTSVVTPVRSIEAFLAELQTEGKVDALRAAGDGWLFGMGSWDPEVAQVPDGDHRFTLCIEEPASPPTGLWRKWIAPSWWLVFEYWTWREEPYEHLEGLGYRFNDADYDTGLHFDAYAPGVPLGGPCELWITVVPLSE